MRDLPELRAVCKAKVRWLKERWPVMEEKARQIGVGKVSGGGSRRSNAVNRTLSQASLVSEGLVCSCLQTAAAMFYLLPRTLLQT